MSAKLFLHLLVLCGIWSQRITETFADEEIKESSDLLVRQKRVVSHLHGEDVAVRIADAPYVVVIREMTRSRCVGSILSSMVVITSAPCVSMGPDYYKVLSGVARLGDGYIQNITEIRRRVGDPHRNSDGVALLIVHPLFVFNSYCQPIRLHTGPVLLGTFGTVHGWGYNFRTVENRGTNIAKHLRSIQVPIISHQDCVHRYQPHLQISVKNVCTYHEQRHSGHIDFGAGLIVDGSLAGVFLWSGLIGQINPQYPDVFAYLHDSFYNQWIRANLQNA